MTRKNTEVRQKQKHGKEVEEKFGFLVFLCALCVFAVRIFLCLRMALCKCVIIRGHSIIALKGLNEIAQGNALGMCAKKSQALKGRKVLLTDYCALSGLV